VTQKESRVEKESEEAKQTQSAVRGTRAVVYSESVRQAPSRRAETAVAGPIQYAVRAGRQAAETAAVVNEPRRETPEKIPWRRNESAKRSSERNSRCRNAGEK